MEEERETAVVGARGKEMEAEAEMGERGSRRRGDRGEEERLEGAHGSSVQCRRGGTRG